MTTQLQKLYKSLRYGLVGVGKVITNPGLAFCAGNLAFFSTSVVESVILSISLLIILSYTCGSHRTGKKYDVPYIAHAIALVLISTYYLTFKSADASFSNIYVIVSISLAIANFTLTDWFHNLVYHGRSSARFKNLIFNPDAYATIAYGCIAYLSADNTYVFGAAILGFTAGLILSSCNAWIKTFTVGAPRLWFSLSCCLISLNAILTGEFVLFLANFLYCLGNTGVYMQSVFRRKITLRDAVCKDLLNIKNNAY